MSFGTTETMRLKELAKRLGHKDVRSTEKWLLNNNIPIIKRSGINVVFRLPVEIAIHVELAKSLMKTYPNRWDDILSSYIPDKKLLNSVLNLCPSVKTPKTIKKRVGKKFIK